MNSQKIVRHIERLFVVPGAATALLASTMVTLGADPASRLNLAANSKLPSGPGLAAAFPADAGLRTNPVVIFADDFESGGLGQGWDETGNKDGKVLDLVSPGRMRGSERNVCASRRISARTPVAD